MSRPIEPPPQRLPAEHQPRRDPTNLAAIDDIKFQTGINTEAILVEENKLSAMVEKLLAEQEDAIWAYARLLARP